MESAERPNFRRPLGRSTDTCFPHLAHNGHRRRLGLTRRNGPAHTRAPRAEGGVMEERTQFLLKPEDLPSAWYNVMPDIASAGMQPLPPLHPGTKEPVTPDLLAPLFPEALIMQEVSTDPWIDIPGEVMDVYGLWRPTPLFRATRLERALDTPARIYFKYEGTSPAGSHKPNTAVAQAYFNKEAGTKRITTETGAGQWGSALSMACRFFDLDCLVFMVKASYEQKPYRRIIAGPEPAHAIRAVIEEAEAAREAGDERVILFNLSGHGFFDMQAYDDYMNGRLPEVEYQDEQLEQGLESVPQVPI